MSFFHVNIHPPPLFATLLAVSECIGERKKLIVAWHHRQKIKVKKEEVLR